MRGLANEFARFRETCLAGQNRDDIKSAEMIYMAGALTATARLLSVLESGLPEKRMLALIRRITREAQAYKDGIIKQADQMEEQA